jgi:sugar/nucleoside kinase (ribokinase family)
LPSEDTQPSIDLLIVGAMALDEAVVDGTTSRLQGGAVYYGGFAAQAAGARTGIWTMLSKGDRVLLNSLKKAGIYVSADWSDGTAGIRNIYRTSDPDHRTCIPLRLPAAFDPQRFPRLQARVVHFAPLVKGEVSLELIRHAARKTSVGLDAQGFVRCHEDGMLVFRDWEAKHEGLRLASYLKCDAVEAEVLTGLSDPVQAARKLAELGPGEVVVTHESGVVLCCRDRIFQAAFTHRRLVGRTGRGDTCMASYLARRLREGPAESLRFAAALTSMKLEQEGPFSGTEQNVRERMKQ